MSENTKSPEELAAEQAAAEQAKAEKEAKAAAAKAEKDAAAAKRKADADAKKAAKEAAKAEAKAKKEADKQAKIDAAAAAKTEKESKRQPEQNGVRRPGPDGLCGQAWAIFDTLSAALKQPVPIADALADAKTKGLNDANVRTEYARWKKFHGIAGRVTKPVPAATEGTSTSTEGQAAA